MKFCPLSDPRMQTIENSQWVRFIHICSEHKPILYPERFFSIGYSFTRWRLSIGIDHKPIYGHDLFSAIADHYANALQRVVSVRMPHLAKSLHRGESKYNGSSGRILRVRQRGAQKTTEPYFKHFNRNFMRLLQMSKGSEERELHLSNQFE